MGKPTGFMEYDREENREVPVRERIKNFKEFHEWLSEDERKAQGARCMNCGVPLCQSGMKLSGMFTGCPLHNLIPEWNDEIYNGHVAHALSRLLKTNNFPEFTGRVCPALCEKACIEGVHDAPVTTKDNELFLIESSFSQGFMRPRIPEVRSGKKVAVVGAGPAGLAAADTLNHRGHNVTVFEREKKIGGLLMYGIPNMKLDKSVISRRRRLMEEEGVVFKTGVDVGKAVKAEELLKDFDAVILACGAKQARGLKAEGMEQAKGIYFAVDYLKEQTKLLLHEEAPGFVSAKGKNVVIIGGGDTGNDCVGTAIRQGAKTVTQLEIMPAPPVERAASNPWPEWPKVLKVDYGQEEAIELFGKDPRIYETTVVAVETKKDGTLRSITTKRMDPVTHKLVDGSEQKLPCELLIIAAGFTGCEAYVPDAFKIGCTDRNVIKTEPEHYAADRTRGIFTAGDMHRGQSLVVWAIAEGRACAHEVDEYLMGYTV